MESVSISVLHRRIFFLEKDVSEKQLKIDSLNSKCEHLSKELSDVKMELCVAKSYINTLPTMPQVHKLKNSLIEETEAKQQLKTDLTKLEQENYDLKNKLSTMTKKIEQCDINLQSKQTEISALQYTIHLWEKRRKAAKEAGQVTVEDVVAEKIQLQQKIQDVLKVVSCREEFLKAKIAKIKALRDEERRNYEDQKKTLTSIENRAAKLEEELQNSRKDYSTLMESTVLLEKRLATLTAELECVQTREKTRDIVFNNVKSCITEIMSAIEAVEKLIAFIQDAISNKFLDPSLLFAARDAITDTVESFNNVDTNKYLDQCTSEITRINKSIEDCQKKIVDIYVSKLTTSVDYPCNIQ